LPFISFLVLVKWLQMVENTCLPGSPESTEAVARDQLLIDAVQHFVKSSLHTLIRHLEDLLANVVAVAVLD